MGVKVIVGLGNPGKAYEATRHNVGFWIVASFGKRHGVVIAKDASSAHLGQGRLNAPSGPVDFLLVKPMAFMNRSGVPVGRILEAFNIPVADLIVAHDDLDLECGRIRIRTRGRSGGHRGVDSIIDQIGSDRFLRLKIGIGRDPAVDPAAYVLTPFRVEEEELVLAAVQRGTEALDLLLTGQIATAMNCYHPLR